MSGKFVNSFKASMLSLENSLCAVIEVPIAVPLSLDSYKALTFHQICQVGFERVCELSSCPSVASTLTSCNWVLPILTVYLNSSPFLLEKLNQQFQFANHFFVMQTNREFCGGRVRVIGRLTKIRDRSDEQCHTNRLVC